MRILFATSELYPLIKMGGLGDVSCNLPQALRKQGVDIRIVLPAYRSVMQNVKQYKTISTINVPDIAGDINILETTLPNSPANAEVTLYLVDAPAYFDRDGNVYSSAGGDDWNDNAIRFGLFCKAIVQMAIGAADIEWVPDIIHCNDWPTGLVPALLSFHKNRPATLFTIHNLAYQGVFSEESVKGLGLPNEFWKHEALEYYGNISFIKGGLVYSDYITTVSPTYAEEILLSEYAYGLEGLLQARSGQVSGILNGVNYDDWNPANDCLIKAPYDIDCIEKKYINKADLQSKFGLPLNKKTPILACIARLVEQKGINLIINALENILVEQDIQCVILGSGEEKYIAALENLRSRYPNNIAIYIGYDEILAHVIEAGADIYLMPSIFEPCGLNQMYSMRYGTVPIVHHTGGLADTIVNVDSDTLRARTATGYTFNDINDDSFLHAIKNSIELYRTSPEQWKQLMFSGMRKNFNWQVSSSTYNRLYQFCHDKKNQSWPLLSSDMHV